VQHGLHLVATTETLTLTSPRAITTHICGFAGYVRINRPGVAEMASLPGNVREQCVSAVGDWNRLIGDVSM
jgi:hypothetical protein